MEKPGQLILATPDRDGTWRQRSLDALERACPALRPARLERSTTHSADGTSHLLAELLPLAEGWDRDGKPTGLHGNPDGPGKQLVWLTIEDGADTWSVEPALPAGIFFNRANVERATGATALSPAKKPAFIFHDGPTHGEEDEVIQTNVYLVPSQ